MSMIDLKEAVVRHTGIFSCEPRGEGSNRFEVQFRHVATDPAELPDIKIQSIQDFYSTFGSLRLFYDDVSGDSAYYIAKVSEWLELESNYTDWLEILDEDDEDEEDDEIVPDWIRNCAVVGEIPHSGNYLLIPHEGEKAGYVYVFEHDGFDFLELAPSLAEFVQGALKPTNSMLMDMASHMTFIDEKSDTQWWILEMIDSTGHRARTED